MRGIDLDKPQNIDKELGRGVIEFDPEIYEKYFKGYDADINLISILTVTILAALILLAVIIRRRQKREEKRLEQYMRVDEYTSEEDRVPPPPDGASALREKLAPEAAGEKVEAKTDQKTWFARLHDGLAKTRQQFSGGLAELFSGKTVLTEELLERIHENLYRADVGVQTADLLVEKVNASFKRDSEIDWPEVKSCLESEISNILSGPACALNTPREGPFVLLVVGVNGVGKTTSCGKLAAHFQSEGKSVMLAAADTFRAAAIDQLKVWGERLGVEVVAHKEGADPAAVAFDAIKSAKAKNVDVLLVDTAGRLHNKKALMDELQKIYRVMGKEIPDAPHETWLVIDATTGQNAAIQVKAFSEAVKLSGLVVTKLDGTAKGGVLVGISDVYKIPIRYVGVGEKADDLQEFSADGYAKSIF